MLENNPALVEAFYLFPPNKFYKPLNSKLIMAKGEKKSSKLKQKVSKILKNKPVAIFLTICLLSLFTLFVMQMFGNIKGNMANKVTLETNYGNIVIQLYEDMPITTTNFKNLVTSKTYDGVIFHRVISNFMIQGGDPTGTGYGDPKIPKIKDEFKHIGGNKNNRGTISMANAGPNTGSSQFFINLVDNNFLDTKHPAFGVVIKGLDIVDKIAAVKTDGRDKPLKDVVIERAVLS
jgi:peptidylprolyl isomerase